MALDAHPLNAVSGIVIGSAIAVHRALGPGLLESAYQRCLERELTLRSVAFASELEIPVRYRGKRLDCGYRLDLVVENCVAVEVKSVEQLIPIHNAQVLTYLGAIRSACRPADQFQCEGTASWNQAAGMERRLRGLRVSL